MQHLLYPLGYIASFCFGLRAFYQWIISEKVGKSVVTREYWYISLLGNLTLLCHALIQYQLPIVLVQTTHAVMVIRNLNLMGPPKEKQMRLTTVLLFLALCLSCSLICFLTIQWMQGISWDQMEWMRTPRQGLLPQNPLWLKWLGTTGVVAFAARFWVQWWLSEKATKSYLGTPFWILSVLGATLSCLYFGITQDYVNFVGPAVGVIPYYRNLWVLKKEDVA